MAISFPMPRVIRATQWLFAYGGFALWMSLGLFTEAYVGKLNFWAGLTFLSIAVVTQVECLRRLHFRDFGLYGYLFALLLGAALIVINFFAVGLATLMTGDLLEGIQ